MNSSLVKSVNLFVNFVTFGLRCSFSLKVTFVDTANDRNRPSRLATDSKRPSTLTSLCQHWEMSFTVSTLHLKCLPVMKLYLFSKLAMIQILDKILLNTKKTLLILVMVIVCVIQYSSMKSVTQK